MKQRASTIRDQQNEILSSVARFTVDLDLHLFFSPLMEEFGDGIVFTRTFQLPFPPSDSIAIGGQSMEGKTIPPLGYRLQEVVWDVDRGRFLATSTEIRSGDPIALLPMNLKSILKNGWSIGSWQKYYDRTWKSPIGDKISFKKFELDWDDEDELFALETQAASKRPEPFNKLLSAIVRLLFTLGNHEEIAYAIHKTKKYFSSEEERSPEYLQAISDYERKTEQQRERARRNATKRAANFA